MHRNWLKACKTADGFAGTFAPYLRLSPTESSESSVGEEECLQLSGTHREHLVVTEVRVRYTLNFSHWFIANLQRCKNPLWKQRWRSNVNPTVSDMSLDLAFTSSVTVMEQQRCFSWFKDEYTKKFGWEMFISFPVASSLFPLPPHALSAPCKGVF